MWSDDADAFEVARMIVGDYTDGHDYIRNGTPSKRPYDALWDTVEENFYPSLSETQWPKRRRATPSSPSTSLSTSPLDRETSLTRFSSLTDISTVFSSGQTEDGDVYVHPSMTVSAIDTSASAGLGVGTKKSNASNLQSGSKPTGTGSKAKKKRTTSTSSSRLKSSQSASAPIPKPPPVHVNNFRTPITVSGVELRPSVAFRTFWWWCAERKRIDDKRRAGLPPPWTSDPTLQSYFFCNSFRVLDKVCQYLITNVIEQGSQEDEEIVFRVVLFNLFTKIETWELLQSHLGPLTWSSYNREAYVDVLKKAAAEGMTLYTGAFIKPAPKFDHKHNYVNHLEFLEILMAAEITLKCKNVKYMADLFEWLVSFPSLGDFSTYQLMLSLSYTKVLNFHPDDFAVEGPGSVSGLKKIFGNRIGERLGKNDGFAMDVMRYLVDNQEVYFGLLDREEGGEGTIKVGLGPQNLPMNIADVEHALCEVDKYCRIAHPNLKGKRTQLTRVFRPPPPPGEEEDEEDDHPSQSRYYGPAVLPKAWSHPARQTPRIRADKVLIIEKRYVIEKIIEHRERDPKLEPKDEQTGKPVDPNMDGYEYRVRWFLYDPEDDTWESGQHLAHDAPGMLKEYKQANGLL